MLHIIIVDVSEIIEVKPMLETGSQNMFEIWNYSLTFTSFAVLAVFVVDMIGHKTKTITSKAFSLASVVGIIIGEFMMTLFESYSLPAAIPVACLAATISSVMLALFLQTKDPEVEGRPSRKRP
jgi:hypothetical protein